MAGLRLLATAVIFASCFSIQAAEVRETLVPGDANCDGEVDISDAVFVLVFLFSGSGEEPCPLADRPELVARVTELEAELTLKVAEIDAKDMEIATLWAELEAYRQAPKLPATGQVTCYDAAGAEVPCDNPDFPGQDGIYRAGCPTESRFVDNKDGTVTDICTQFMWQKVSTTERYDWQNALEYCESLTLAEHEDWRLPNVRELQSIADYGRDHPAIDLIFEAAMSWYWSSSSMAITLTEAWAVCFGYGGAIQEFDKTSTFYVRAVRGGL